MKVGETLMQLVAYKNTKKNDGGRATEEMAIDSEVEVGQSMEHQGQNPGSGEQGIY